MDVYKPYFNATERAKKNNFNVDKMQFIEKTPYDKIHNKFCKFILGIKKCSSNFSARYELGRYPIDNFIKTQSLLYEDRLLSFSTNNVFPNTRTFVLVLTYYVNHSL
jgi:hypothetical protein